MPLSIVANQAASYAQAGINARNDAMVKNTQRLSSGLRVFSAQEDAAATAVGTSLKIENSTLKAATLNASSGASMLQIADGAMGQVSELLTRMLTLAQASASGHMDDATRSLTNAEFSSLQSEVDRIARSSEFNGVNMLAGSKTFTTPTASDLVGAGVTASRFDQNLVTGDASFRFTYDASTETATLARTDGTGVSSQSIQLTSILNTIAGTGQNLDPSQGMDLGFASLGVTMHLDSNFDRGTDIGPAPVLTVNASNIAIATPAFTTQATGVPLATVPSLGALTTGYDNASGVLTVPVVSDGTSVKLGALPGVSYKVGSNPQTASGAASDTLVTAGTNSVGIYVDMPGGGTQLVGTWTSGAVSTTSADTGSLALSLGSGVFGAAYQDDNGATRLTYKIGTGIEPGRDILYVDVPAVTLKALGLDATNISTQGSALGAVATLQGAMDILNQGRANVGAQQLRMEQVSNNLGVVSENNTSAMSSLLDVDVPAEISDFTNNQAMLQASVAMLSRANRLPDMLMELLRNS
ncbi:MAG: hypothetical protein GC129_03075 [Proteobacteria bacterium]|nr:hypothetical protein [Pseudomonadota bacterium]